MSRVFAPVVIVLRDPAGDGVPSASGARPDAIRRQDSQHQKRRRVIRLSFSPEVRGTLSLVDRDVASLNGDARRDERGSARYPGAKDDEQRRGQIARLVGAFTIVRHLQPEGEPSDEDGRIGPGDAAAHRGHVANYVQAVDVKVEARAGDVIEEFGLTARTVRAVHLCGERDGAFLAAKGDLIPSRGRGDDAVAASPDDADVERQRRGQKAKSSELEIA